MKHTKKYKQSKWVTENTKEYDERDVLGAKRYCEAYLDGYNQALFMSDFVRKSEQLPTDEDCVNAIKKQLNDNGFKTEPQ